MTDTDALLCPTCRGSGRITVGPCARPDVEAKRVAAKAMSKEGYSVRQIMRILGYKSPRSVQCLLEGRS